MFGSGTSISITTQLVTGVPLNRSVLLLTFEGKKTSVFVAFALGAERPRARALVALSDVFVGGVVERRLLSGWSFQQPLEPCE